MHYPRIADIILHNLSFVQPAEIAFVQGLGEVPVV